jgi:hypothetical protein
MTQKQNTEVAVQITQLTRRVTIIQSAKTPWIFVLIVLVVEALLAAFAASAIQRLGRC